MSYILDALKHSQDSRSRGAIPGLASQTAAVRPEPSRRERIWRLVALITVVVLLVVLAAMGWQRWLAPSVGAGDGLPSMAERPEPVAALATAAAPPAPRAAAPVAGVAPATPPPVSSAPAQSPSQSQAPGLEALQQLAGVRVDVDQPPPAAPPAAGAAAAGPPPIVQKLELPVERLPLTAPAARSQPPAAGAPLREESSAPGAQPQLAEYGEVEHWKELPAPIQRQLRETPFNVHIYSSDPKLRFVKSSGRTLREGDAINGELRVLHITRDGVIVGYKGGKYWMRLS